MCIMNRLRQLESMNHSVLIGGSRGGRAGACPPTGPNSFIFAYIFTEKCPHWRPKPPKMGPRPPLQKILDLALVLFLNWCHITRRHPLKQTIHDIYIRYTANPSNVKRC